MKLVKSFMELFNYWAFCEICNNFNLNTISFLEYKKRKGK